MRESGGAAAADQTAVRDRSSLIVPVWLERTSAWATRLIVIAVALGGVLWIALRLRAVLVPLLVAILFASALRPAASFLERHRFPRSLAAALPIATIGAVLSLGGWVVYRRTTDTLVSDEITEAQIRTRIEDWLSSRPLDLTPAQIESGEARLRDWLSSGVGSFGVQQATLVVQLLGGALLATVLTFFLLKDGSQMWGSITARVNPVRSVALRRSGTAITATMSAYLRSVALTGLADALLIGIGLWILGVPLIIPLVLLTALAGLFPLVGAVVAGAAAATVALITVGPATAFWVIVLTLVVQQFEGNVMQPLVMARRVSIHPVVVLLSLTAGGAVAGLAGAFLAVPVVASMIAAVQAFSADMDVAESEPIEAV